ncbi:hypothetical protein BDZ97DRAFT_1761928 [Flammula alnicola]|nr:hypothetical protein BDZ97DRAFT_1761928 [Flammula alnicola]
MSSSRLHKTGSLLWGHRKQCAPCIEHGYVTATRAPAAPWVVRPRGVREVVRGGGRWQAIDVAGDGSGKPCDRRWPSSISSTSWSPSYERAQHGASLRLWLSMAMRSGQVATCHHHCAAINARSRTTFARPTFDFAQHTVHCTYVVPSASPHAAARARTRAWAEACSRRGQLKQLYAEMFGKSDAGVLDALMELAQGSEGERKGVIKEERDVVEDIYEAIMRLHALAIDLLVPARDDFAELPTHRLGDLEEVVPTAQSQQAPVM